MYGTQHQAVAIAWETVGELQKAQRRTEAEQRSQPMSTPELSNFEVYCSLNPDAPECRIYDV
jgi:hypothetical protein